MVNYDYAKYDSAIIKLLSVNDKLSVPEIVALVLKTKESRRKNNLVCAMHRYVHRHMKRFRDEYEGIINSSENLDVDYKDVKHLWLKDKTTSLFVKNPNYQEPIQQEYSNLHELILADIRNFTPKFETLKRVNNNESHLLIIDPADIHIGKLSSSFETGEDYNNQIAVKRVLEGIEGLITKSKGFHIDKILFIGGNDILHVDNPKNTTTGGTSQDTDGMWYDNFNIAKNLYLNILKKLITIADV